MTLGRPRSVRARAVVSAGVVVLVGTSVLAILAVVLVHEAALRSLDDSLSAATSNVSAQLTADPPSSSDPIQLAPLDPREPVVVQVIGADGHLIANTPGVATTERICSSTRPVPGSTDTVQLTLGGSSATFRVLSEPMTLSGEPVLVCAARSDESAEATWRTVAVILAVAIPVITALVCLLVARRVGDALHAVGELTSQTRAIEQLSEAHLPSPGTGDEIEQLTDTLNEMLARLFAQTTATRRFVADASHELRTPLTSLRIALELGRDDTAQPQWVDDAISDLDALTAVVEDLLALARADSRAPMRPTVVHLPVAVQDDIDAIGRWRRDITVCTSTTTVDAFIDPRGIQRIIRNLLSNAVRHASHRVDVTFSTDGRAVTIEVRDDGPGFPADQLTQVFERFVRLDDSRTRDTGGSGLGLPIVAAVARQGGGTATAYPGPGGRIVVTVPAAAASSGPPSQVESTEQRSRHVT